jgi:hypothetical protein
MAPVDVCSCVFDSAQELYTYLEVLQVL